MSSRSKSRFNAMRKQAGSMAITVAFWFIALIGFAALAFDVGHLMVVRTELQNAADAAALAGANCLDRTAAASGANCTSTLSSALNWGTAVTMATSSISMNKSDSVALATGAVQAGYWNINGGTSLQPTSLTPLGQCTVVSGTMVTSCDRPAVMVTLDKTGASNGGPVGTLIASMFGGAGVSLTAKAVAVLSAPGQVNPGTLIPYAINQCMYDQYWDPVTNTPRKATTSTLNGVPQVIGQPWVLRIGSSYHYGACDSGQWTSFDQDVNSASAVKNLITNGNPTSLGIGDNIWIEPGTKTSLYDDLGTKYDVPGGSNVTLPVVNQHCDWDTNAQAPITAFAGFHISDVQGGSGKYVEGSFTTGMVTGGSSGTGPYYGTYTPPRLAR